MNRAAGLVLGVLVAAAPLTGCDRGAGAEGSAGPGGAWQELEVAWHVDGDTLGVRVLEDGPAGRRGEEVTVRLLEIDTPEVHPERECFGAEAAAELARLLPRGRTVLGEPDRQRTDPYGRTLLYLYADLPGDGAEEQVMVNQRLVRDGYAETVLFPPNDRHIDTLRRAEDQARRDGAGLWGRCR